MPGHTRWADIKARRPMTPEMREAYARAERSFQFGAAVRAAREAAGLSQSELARRMGTNQPTIARLEMGEGDPRLSTIDRINRALGTELVAFPKEESTLSLQRDSFGCLTAAPAPQDTSLRILASLGGGIHSGRPNSFSPLRDLGAEPATCSPVQGARWRTQTVALSRECLGAASSLPERSGRFLPGLKSRASAPDMR
jgi:transcriptional regulator with XRE-family HTH domain